MTARLLYLLRHATAQDRALPIADADRALTTKGERQARQVAIFCADRQLLPHLLLSSPIRRAHQTAQLLARHLPRCAAPQSADWLSTGSSVEQALDGLRSTLAQHPGDPWLVGHEPHLSALMAALLGAPATTFLLKKASLSCLALPENAAPQLLWSLPCGLMD